MGGGGGGLAIACAMNVKGKHMHIYFPAAFEVLLEIIAIKPKWNTMLKEKGEYKSLPPSIHEEVIVMLMSIYQNDMIINKYV